MESMDRLLYHTNPIMDSKLSSPFSYLSETSFFPREVTSCKSEVFPDRYGTSCRKQAASSPFEIFMPIEFQTTKSPDYLEPRHDQAATNGSLDLTAAQTSNGATKSHSLSLLRSLDGNTRAKIGMSTLHALCFAKENGVSTKIPPFENSLFSSSLPELYNRKSEISSRHTHIDQSLDTAPRDNFEEEQFTSLEEIEAQTIGNLLPDDDDLFGGVNDCIMQPNGDDMEELDLFYNVGGMDLEDCDFSRGQKYIKSGTNGSTGGKQPTSKKEINQGILIVSNVDSSTSDDNLLSIFCVYGDIKEIQSVPRSNHQKLIEYFDTRAAEAALNALNGSKIAGKQIKLEPVTYGGIKDLLKRAIELQQSASQIPYLGSQLQNGISSTVPDSLPSLGNKTDHLTGQLKFDTWGSPNFHPHSLGDYRDGFMNGFQTSSNMSQQMHKFSPNGHSLEQGVFGSAVSGSSPLNGHDSIWSNSCRTQRPDTMWSNSLSYMNGVHGSPSAMLLASDNHHVGSAPAVNSSIWERHQSYAAAGSPETSVFHPGSWGSTRMSKTPMHSVDFVPNNMYPHVGGNCMDLQMPSTAVVGFHSSPHQRCMMFPGRGQRLPGLCSYDPPSERVRSRRTDSASNQASADKKQFELDVERIIRGEDSRTTLMIKNIPNKYTSKMLLAAIDENHRGTYDFIYLPIDFKNKCNVGYAFINITDPSQIIPFYKAFNGKKWEKFNSEKVASLAYARIQGKSALISHFQNSSLMNEDKRCRPILFNTEGPNAGDQVPFPMGVNVSRSRIGKTRSISSLEEKNHQEAAAMEGDHFSKRRGEESTSSE